MPTKIYVGNLPWRATDEQLTTMFSAHGEVTEARIVTDRETGRSRGFAFVTMTDASQAQSAIQAINGASMEGRALVVNEAREQSRPPRGPGGGGGGFGGGGGGFGGGGGGGFGGSRGSGGPRR
ncbi:MAG: RNA-binding protein, partial [Betaproteobacteria bacterium]|nr:RNA-binding protein [Betaproteobacteria bacterium]